MLYTDASFKELCNFYPQLYAEQNLQNNVYRTKDGNNEKGSVILPFLNRSASYEGQILQLWHHWNGLISVLSVSKYKAIV